MQIARQIDIRLSPIADRVRRKRETAVVLTQYALVRRTQARDERLLPAALPVLVLLCKRQQQYFQKLIGRYRFVRTKRPVRISIQNALVDKPVNRPLRPMPLRVGKARLHCGCGCGRSCSCCQSGPLCPLYRISASRHCKRQQYRFHSIHP